MCHSVGASMKSRLASLAVGGFVVSAIGLCASGSPASGSPAAAIPPGPWTGEWKVVRIESDSGRRLPGGRLTFAQSGKVVCANWSWSPFADGRLHDLANQQQLGQQGRAPIGGPHTEMGRLDDPRP